MEESRQQYLHDVLETNRMAHVKDLMVKYRSQRDEVKTRILEEYQDIYTPINSGSFAKHTAINTKFDLDLAVPFKRGSFGTLEEMADHLYNFLRDEYENAAAVRKQKVSIGIEFAPDDDLDVISLDIVPGRELNQGQYLEDKKLNLHVNSQFGIFEERSFIQTNIAAHIAHIQAKTNEREVIRLLKIWKTKNYEPYKSFFLELITIKAFEKKNIAGNLWERLESVLQYIRDNVAKEGFTLADPGNTANNVANILTDTERQNLSAKMDTMINNINNSADDLKIYFPKNPDFVINNLQKNSSGYGLKTTTASTAIAATDQPFSIPPAKQRFG
jgi:hypothetical protein